MTLFTRIKNLLIHRITCDQVTETGLHNLRCIRQIAPLSKIQSFTALYLCHIYKFGTFWQIYMKTNLFDTSNVKVCYQVMTVTKNPMLIHEKFLFVTKISLD